MTREDLFIAIGEVENSRLVRSELMISKPSDNKEKSAMKKDKKLSTSRIIRNVLFAAIIVSMLTVTAFAAGYLIYDSPQAMLTALFGDQTGYDHKDVTLVTDPEKPNSPVESPAHDRVPVDEDVMETQVAPLVSPVGQSIHWMDRTMMIDANLYDPATKCGVLTYRLESQTGLSEYTVSDDGMLCFVNAEPLHSNQYGKHYIIQDKTTDTVLTAAYYYQLRNPETSDLELSMSYGAVLDPGQTAESALDDLEQELRQKNTQDQALSKLEDFLGKEDYDALAGSLSKEQLADKAYYELAFREFDQRYTCPDKIILPEQTLGQMDSIRLEDGRILISAIAMYVQTSDIEDYPASFNDVVKIRLQNGDEYVVRDDSTANYVFAVGKNDRDVTYMFNRILDVSQIKSVILDGGLEFFVE